MNSQTQWYPLDIIRWTTQFFTEKGIPNPRHDAEYLLASILKCPRIDLYLKHDREISTLHRTQYKELIQRRARREPLQYILGTQDFWKLTLKVTPDVLIPRPETELLVEAALKILQQNAATNPTILDIGTGSGCIALTLAQEIPNSQVIATEISKPALAIAQANAASLDLKDRVHFVLTDLTSTLAWQAEGRCFDIIISNPPYIARTEFPSLQPEVRDFEPRVALDGGEDGLDFYPRIFQDAQILLAEGGWLLLEMGEGHADALMAMGEKTQMFSEIAVIPDHQGISRILKAQRGHHG